MWHQSPSISPVAQLEHAAREHDDVGVGLRHDPGRPACQAWHSGHGAQSLPNMRSGMSWPPSGQPKGV